MRFVFTSFVALLFAAALLAAPTRHVQTRKFAPQPVVARGAKASKANAVASKKSRTAVRSNGKTKAKAKVAYVRQVQTKWVRGRRVNVVRWVPANRVRVYVDPWSVPNFTDPTEGDSDEGEDLIVRRAAVDALGSLNGSVVVADPNTGRVLTIVNQKLSFQPGFTPCSTIKIVTALAAMQEGLVDRFTMLQLGRRSQMDLTEALALSNNPYFATLGERMGFEKVVSHARNLGLGEAAGYNIPEERVGPITDNPARAGGVGMMTSFGHGFRMSPLQLTAITSAVANNGTIYYLQYPRTQEAIDAFTPKVKRTPGIEDFIPEIKPGLFGAVEYGTGRRAGYEQAESLLGKTGTCTDHERTGTHMGWFTSFNEFGRRKLVVTVMLTGGRAVSGPVASGVAGNFFRNLSRVNYFEADMISSAKQTPAVKSTTDRILSAITGLIK